MAEIAIAAVASSFHRSVEAGLRRIEAILGRARAAGAQLVVLPESAIGGHLREHRRPEVAPELPEALHPDGPELARLVELAGDLVVCAGYTEAGDRDGVIHSSAICVGGGKVLGHQRKVHLPPTERFAYTAGDGFTAFDTPLGRVGMLLCYDKLFPEAARALALDGASLIACLAAWPLDRHAPARRPSRDRQTLHFDAFDVARAVENQVVWVSANGAGRWGGVRMAGRAKVVDPDGRTLAATGRRGGMAVARVDVAREVAAVRGRIDHLGDRRPGTYGPIIGQTGLPAGATG